MFHRKSTFSVALLQQKDIERVVARSNVIAARVWRMAAAVARANKIHTSTGLRVRDFYEYETDLVEAELITLMSYAFLLRTRLGRRRRSLAKSLVLSVQLSVQSDARRIADQFDLDLGKLKDRFEPLARKAVKKTFADIRSTMNTALARATKEGRSTQRAVEDVIASLRKHGIHPRRNSYIETLVRTHAAVAYGAAHRISFDSDPDVVGFEYVTVGDNRVREAHVKLDGTYRLKDDEFWDTFWPPNGWNCRCQAVAVYDDSIMQTRIPRGVEPDEGFDFDPGDLAR